MSVPDDMSKLPIPAPPEPILMGMEQVIPHVNEIVDDLLKLGLPESKYHDKAEIANGWAIHIRDHLSDCCPSHLLDDIAQIQMGLHTSIILCTCSNEYNHEFVTAMIQIISTHMNRCISEASAKVMVNERRN